MALTVDTSALIAVIVDEPQREAVIDFARGEDLVAPASVRWEIGNALSALIKRRRLTLTQALAAVELYEQIPIRYTDVSLPESLELAAQYNLYAYDAFVIQCARRFGTRLLSLDANLVRVAQDIGIAALEVDG